MIRTSIILLEQAGACVRLKYVSRWRAGRPEEELFPLVALLEVPGLKVPEDAIWALRAVPMEDVPERDRVARLFAAACAERALMRERAAGREPDPRSWEAVEVARLFAMGEVTSRGLSDARAAARAAAWASADDAAWAAKAAAWAAACEESAFGDCAYDISDAEGAAKYIVTATLPVPKPQPAPEVKGEVSAPTPPVEKPAKKGKK